MEARRERRIEGRNAVQWRVERQERKKEEANEGKQKQK
jgi:hypothetical protein